jgi:hypothetical protein
VYLRVGATPAGVVTSVSIASPHLQTVEDRNWVPPQFEGWLRDRMARLARAGRGATVEGAPEGAPAPIDKEANIEMARALGRDLHGFLPASLRDALQVLAGLDRPIAVQVYTTDPLFPWELLSYPLADGSWSDFLGLRGSVARWHLEERGLVRARPPALLQGGAVVSIAPHYRNDALRDQEEDLKGLPEGVRTRVREIAGTRAALRAAVADRTTRMSVLHFAGHGRILRRDGVALPEFVLRLEDGEVASADWAGLGAAPRPDHPLVFLNACEQGQEEGSAGLLEGWPGAILESGASGYVGGLWSLGDAAAAGFAQRFYAAAFAGETVAAAVARARRAFLETGDPTYLAYVYYGDLGLRLGSL